MKPRKRVCVVGAGPSGLVAMKELLEEGHEVRCYEKSSQEGGVFNGPPAGRSYDSLKLTVSNYFMAFSSLPPERGEARRYWTKREYRAYLTRFVERFGLLPHIAALTRAENRAEEEIFYVQPQLKTLVNYTTYMNSLAELVGCQARPWELASDPRLFLRVYLGSNVSYTYRLSGPKSEPELAREVISRLPIALELPEILLLSGAWVLSKGVEAATSLAAAFRPASAEAVLS